MMHYIIVLIYVGIYLVSTVEALNRAFHTVTRRLLPSFGVSGNYGGIAHAGILVSDVIESVEFYRKAFDFEDVSHMRNKSLPFDGAFLAVGGTSQIHLMCLPNPDPTVGRPEHGGRDRHVSITCLPGTVERLVRTLSGLSHPYTMSKSGRAALFTRDLDGNALEFMEVGDLVN